VDLAIKVLGTMATTKVLTRDLSLTGFLIKIVFWHFARQMYLSYKHMCVQCAVSGP